VILLWRRSRISSREIPLVGCCIQWSIGEVKTTSRSRWWRLNWMRFAETTALRHRTLAEHPNESVIVTL
jgi:hypothetical protein